MPVDPALVNNRLKLARPLVLRSDFSPLG